MSKMNSSMTKQELAERYMQNESHPPSGRTLGANVVDVDVKNNTMRVLFDGKPEFLNPAGVVQGGFQAAMLDDVFGKLCILATWPGHTMVTLEMQTKYVSSAPAGQLTVEAQVVRQGKSVIFLKGEIKDADGKVATTATATCRIVEYKSAVSK
jgi:uncharacterized protein (TIGR00369 family)